MRRIFYSLLFTSLFVSNIFGQFGKNKVQYKEYEWFFIQTTHFDIYFNEEGKTAAEFAANVAEESLNSIERKLNFKINNRLTLVIYNSHNDFQETNTTDEYLSQGIGGFTEPFKNRVVFPFEGSWQKYRHVIHHELVHAVMRDYLYGGTVQNIVAKGITLQLPHWFHEGMAEYLSSDWETNSDMFISNAVINEFLPDIERLSGYFGYRGGQSVFHYIGETYGEEKVGELLSKIQGVGNFEGGLKATIGLSLEELNERWKKDLKKKYWPSIADRLDPDEFAKRLTKNEETGGFYNTSPAISPQGDKIAFLSDRDIFMDLYLLDAYTGKVIKRILESGQTNNFEELNVLFPALTWAPDNKRIALSGKLNGYDVIYIIDSETEEIEQLPFKLNGIESTSWSADGSMIAFNGSSSKQSDIYIYNFNTGELSNITNDIFSDGEPSWGPEGKKIYFSSDRGNYLNEKMAIADNFKLVDHNYSQLDLYSVELGNKQIARITDWPLSDEKSARVSPDGKELIFTSDYNGITNIYKKRLDLSKNDAISIVNINAVPLTNSLNGIDQISITKDGKKLVFTSLYKLGYNIFMLDNPFEMEPAADELEQTLFMKSLIDKMKEESKLNQIASVDKIDELEVEEIDSNEKDNSGKEKAEEFENVPITSKKDSSDNNFVFYTGQYVDQDSVKKDSTKKDYSNYIFGVDEDSTKSEVKISDRKDLFTQKLDDNGNYLVNKYKINFSPDLIYANAGYSTLYGVLGTTVLSFSDVLGNHRIIGITSLQVDLKNSDYGLSYYYLPKRWDLGIEGFHTARFVYLTRGGGSNLFRFRNFGGVVSISYPFSTFYRVNGSLAYLNVSSENLDNIAEPTDKRSYLIPTASFVHDNVLYGYTSPIEGTRYNITAFGDPGIADSKRSFYSLTWDYRTYFRFWYDNSFVFRVSGGFSGGANPQRFFVGGTDNWINRTFSTGDIPLENASDFAFLSPALPLRGYDYAEQIGTKYSLLNLELRMPVIRYLLTGPLPLLFQNILGTAFIDAGSAWNNSDKLRFFTKDLNGNTVTDDLLIGTGFGARAFVLFALLRFDVAWKWNVEGFSKPRYYISLGTDF